VLRFARAGHDAGYATAELEERVLALADALDLTDAQVSATPTMVDVSIGPLARQHTYALRVRPAPVDLGEIARLDDLVQDVLDGSVDGESALGRLDEIGARPLERPWPVLVGAYGLAGAALTPVIGGSWHEALAAAGVGLLVGAVALAATWVPRLQPVAALVASIVASFCAAALVRLGIRASPDVVALAALVTFLPGMTLTAGVRELATEHLQSGVANTANALVQLLGLVVGYEVGRSIAVSWFGAAHQVAPHVPVIEVQVLAAAAAGVAFTATLRARSRDAMIMCAGTVLALAANRAGSALLGRQAGVFGAALAVGIAGGLIGYRLRRSPLVFLVPGVFMLVPGSAGFNSALQLLTDKTVSGVTAGFDTFVTAISIAYGLMIATVVLPRRFTHVGPRPGHRRR
jgi:uncharacterized membrane protein YjjP (DUF1212 family)